MSLPHTINRLNKYITISINGLLIKSLKNRSKTTLSIQKVSVKFNYRLIFQKVSYSTCSPIVPYLRPVKCWCEVRKLRQKAGKTTLFTRIILSERDPSLSESALVEEEDGTQIIKTEYKRFIKNTIQNLSYLSVIKGRRRKTFLFISNPDEFVIPKTRKCTTSSQLKYGGELMGKINIFLILGQAPEVISKLFCTGEVMLILFYNLHVMPWYYT